VLTNFSKARKSQKGVVHPGVVAELPAVEGEVSHREDAVVLEAVLLVDVADRGVASRLEVAAVVGAVSLLAVDEVAPLPGAEAVFKKSYGEQNLWLVEHELQYNTEVIVGILIANPLLRVIKRSVRNDKQPAYSQLLCTGMTTFDTVAPVYADALCFSSASFQTSHLVERIACLPRVRISR
jgi:hypothetical protein